MVGNVSYGSLPFDEQIEYFRNKTNMPSERWADVWREAHNRSFTVAGAMRDDLLADFRKAVDKAISEGKSLNWFKSQFKDIVKQYGWEHNGDADWRAQVIYETNLRQSYSAGREQQMEELKHLRPYGIYKHSGSEHPRHLHLSWDNLVVSLDDPWWDTHTPTNGYGCKCKKMSASKKTLERLGLKVTGAPKVEHYEWVDKVTGEIHKLPKGIDPSFDYTPKTSAQLTQRVKKVVAEKPPLEERLPVRVVDHAFSTVKGVNAQAISNALASLNNDSVPLLQSFMKRHDIKSLILKAGELSGGKKGFLIEKEVEAYLQTGRAHPRVTYSTRNVSRTNGFTSRAWNHVVAKAKSTDNLSKVQMTEVRDAIANVIQSGAKPWSFSAVTRQEIQNNAAGVLVTWAHEIGHQVYFKMGRPLLDRDILVQAITKYSTTNMDEWFAEHFAAWLMAPQALKQHKPDIFEFINQAVESVK